MEAGLNFDRQSLASSILTGKPNPYVYLKFGLSRAGVPVGMSNLMADVRASD